MAECNGDTHAIETKYMKCCKARMSWQPKLATLTSLRISCRNSKLVSMPRTGLISPTKTSIVEQNTTDVSLYGFDISHLRPNVQFNLFVGTIFGFNVIYAYLQELISVHMAGRRFSLSISVIQFFGYACWSWTLTKIRKWNLARKKDIPFLHVKCENQFCPSSCTSSVTKNKTNSTFKDELEDELFRDAELAEEEVANNTDREVEINFERDVTDTDDKHSKLNPSVKIFIFLSILRAIDVGMTNGAMRYINYPMKTLIKSSKVAFTMLGGMMIGRNTYKRCDYVMVAMLVCGLAIFIHADMYLTSGLLHYMGIAMLVISLSCDGAFVNFSELVMKKYSISQDEFLFNIYSVSFLMTLMAAISHGEFIIAFRYFFLQNGSLSDINDGVILKIRDRNNEVPVWTVLTKITVFVIFTLSGLCGSSSANAMAKHYGALCMSITTTSRKAFTLFLSFAAFKSNTCTPEHLLGILFFVAGLFLKTAGVGFKLSGKSGCPYQTLDVKNVDAENEEICENAICLSVMNIGDDTREAIGNVSIEAEKISHIKVG